MAINETQLDTWSSQGSISQSKATYESLRTILNDNSAVYSSKDYSIFLQGSYGNDTNIYADSDVDVVINLNSTYYYDTDDLTPNDKTNFNSAFSLASYSYSDFKSGVITHLTNKLGSSVKPGNKAIFIQGNGSRRDADVLPSALYRKYLSFSNIYSPSFIEGICFWDTKGIQIINYPKQHSANCTQKHQMTSGRFKPMVRIFKNIRNSMIQKGLLEDGVAPSYFLEGLLYNVPNVNFVYRYLDSIPLILNWVGSSDHSKLLCANEQYYLVHPTSPVTWRIENLQIFLRAINNFWQSYK